ncbi:hypothetical protein OIU79_011629 [Salix purpurea]|uniref:Uncharacterized protein n=1 Tax=Salix purpurea TaxID=77065 RepID=A0A9Q0T2K3_SALPP|nr:hypothetical protein OIU79_011629 [Salix purpurea]
MEEESLILPGSDVTDEYLTDFDLDGDLSPGFPIKEEMIEESESCGASVSDSSSTVMAGVEFVGVAGKLAGSDTGFPGKGLSEERRGFDFGEGYLAERMMIDGRDGAEFGDDQWLDRVLMGWGPVEVEGWT